MNTLKMEPSDTNTNSLLHQVKQEPNIMDVDKSEDILLGTIKVEIFETKPACPSNSNQISDVLSSVKTETEYSDHDHFLNFNTAGDTKQWTVTSSAVIPLVKEHSIDSDHGLSESTQPEGTMQAVLVNDLLSSSANGSDANKQDPLKSHTPKFVDIKECKDGDKSVSKTNPDTGLPQGRTNTSNQGGFTSKGQLCNHQHVHAREKPYKCTVCEKVFTHSYHLSRHKRIHTGEKPYKCSVCGKEFTLQHHLSTHRRIHTGEKPYKCSVCGKEFTRSANVTQHQRIHTGEKPYTCSLCGRSFTDFSTLHKHKRIHTGDKPYKCSVCGKEFTQLGSLARHQRIHTGEKPYKCLACGKEFTYSNALTDHMRLHKGEKPYKCSVCGKEFTQLSGLTQHQRIHTGEKPHKCSVCGMAFTQSSSLSKHQRIKHRGEKTCNGMVFTCSGSLSRHQRAHTGEKPYTCSVCDKEFTV